MHIKHAAGGLLVDRAKAEGERLRRVSMTGLGGDLIVALEAARNINLDDVVVSTQDMDLLDVDEMIIKLGAGVKRDLPIIMELEDAPGSLRLSDDLPDVLKASHGHGEHGGGHDTHGEEHGATEHHEGPSAHDVPEGSHEPHREHKLHDAPHETHGEAPHEEWGTLTEEFPVSQ